MIKRKILKNSQNNKFYCIRHEHKNNQDYRIFQTKVGSKANLTSNPDRETRK
jgi:hypothetical protein